MAEEIQTNVTFDINPQMVAEQVLGFIQDATPTVNRGLSSFGLKTKGDPAIHIEGHRIRLSWFLEEADHG